jgi:hypothetical protein
MAALYEARDAHYSAAFSEPLLWRRTSWKVFIAEKDGTLLQGLRFKAKAKL